jgi:periplasmic divalent cation tolerance protein
MTDYLTALTTTDTQAAAEALAESAVTARVAACAQIVGPITSVYWWEGSVQRDQEWQIIFKTTTERYPALETHIKAEHSYDVPEVIAGPIVAGNPDYLSWLSAETRPQDSAN